jgi:hypothetical protein
VVVRTFKGTWAIDRGLYSKWRAPVARRVVRSRQALLRRRRACIRVCFTPVAARPLCRSRSSQHILNKVRKEHRRIDNLCMPLSPHANRSDSLRLDELCARRINLVRPSARAPARHVRSTSATDHARTSFCVFSSLSVLSTLSITVLTSRVCSASFSCCSKRTQLSSTALTSEASCTFWRCTNASCSSFAVSCVRQTVSVFPNEGQRSKREPDATVKAAPYMGAGHPQGGSGVWRTRVP